MKLISKYAEWLLYEKARSLQEKHTAWRCIHINFSDFPEQYSEGLRTHTVTNIIKELLEGDDGYIYLCDDGDVFILFQGQVGPVLEKMGEQFKELGQLFGPQQDGGLCIIYDLSKHWQEFMILCTEKGAHLSPHSGAKNMITEKVSEAPKQSLPELDRPQFEVAAARKDMRKKLQVLVVEDEPFTRKLVCMALRGNYDVVEAGDGTAALLAYNSTAPDAVFLDIELPDVNGHVLLNKILAFDPQAFVVMLSANSVKENILAALEKGAQGFVTKPFAKERLIHYLRVCETTRNPKRSA